MDGSVICSFDFNLDFKTNIFDGIQIIKNSQNKVFLNYFNHIIDYETNYGKENVLWNNNRVDFVHFLLLINSSINL